MFLFTTPSPTPGPTPAPDPANPVIDAIRQGAARTGTSFEYLLDAARRESALDPAAKAPTSSATGLFQFIEQTWLGLVKSEGDRIGLSQEAGAVTARQDGTLTVADPSARQAILKLREDPQLASLMAGALTQQNRDALAAAIGRTPSDGELYAAHVLGARGASDLIGAAAATPDRAAALDFPEAARANRGIFYDRGGRARAASEVYGLLTQGPARRPTTGEAADPVAPPGIAVPPASSGLRGLFQTGGRAGPISDAVAKIWRVNNGEGRGRVATAAFFPRTASLGEGPAAMDGMAPDATLAAPAILASAAPASSGASPVQASLPALPISPPLPPSRPRAPIGRRAGRPLDLASVMSARP